MGTHHKPGDNELIENCWVIIPAYNEAGIIQSTVAQVRSYFPQVVVVDDGSSDATASLARAAGSSVVSHLVNLGQGAALQTGINFALSRQAEYLVTFDADGQHRVEDILEMLAVLRREQLDIALGSRFIGETENMPPQRYVTLKLAILFTNLCYKLKLTDTHNGLRVMHAEAARRINIRFNGMAHASEILEQIANQKMKYVEMPVKILYTDYSIEKGQRIGGSARILWDLFFGWLTR